MSRSGTGSHLAGAVRDLHRHRGALAGCAPQLQLILLSVNHAEPLVDVAQADAALQRLAEPFRRHPHPVVAHLDECGTVAPLGSEEDAAAADLAREAVLDGVLDE